MVEITKAFQDLSATTSDDNTTVYRVNDKRSVIVADGNFTITNESGDILGTIAIQNFAHSPRIGFRKIKNLIQ